MHVVCNGVTIDVSSRKKGTRRQRCRRGAVSGIWDYGWWFRADGWASSAVPYSYAEHWFDETLATGRQRETKGQERRGDKKRRGENRSFITVESCCGSFLLNTIPIFFHLTSSKFWIWLAASEWWWHSRSTSFMRAWSRRNSSPSSCSCSPPPPPPLLLLLWPWSWGRLSWWVVYRSPRPITTIV